MKKLLYLLVVILLTINTISCRAPQNIAYLQEKDSIDIENTSQFGYLYDARIMPKDLLTIMVSATDPEAVQVFNLTVPSRTTGITTTSQPQLQTYLVDNNGQINFPVVGAVTMKGLTKRQAEEKIRDLLRTYLKEDPLVTVSFVNYKISVLGEVARPNTFTISNEKVNIFEALALAGDMTIWGRRDNVKIIREDPEGNKNILLMNLNDENIIYSPNFYLQQNDVVYVEPNKVKARNSEIGSATGIWLSGASILISVATLVINILK